MSPGDRITATEVCRRLGVGRTWLYQLVEKGEVPCTVDRSGSRARYTFSSAAIEGYIEAGGYERTVHLLPGRIMRAEPPENSASGVGVEALVRERDEARSEASELRAALAQEQQARVAADMRIDELMRLLGARNTMIRAVLDADPSWGDVLGDVDGGGSRS